MVQIQSSGISLSLYLRPLCMIRGSSSTASPSSIFLPTTLPSARRRAFEETEWHRVTCLNGVAKTVAEYVEKG